ncbi:HisA/HisF-related TIM barrel protein [Alphaproteobacteria bacterium]|nr:HisA/HisF-related TIM barrel protein [Alphaproteobacteria bacterium]MDB2324430.1 HisA/HisF-related TIM barrel protein [Alphaproteobacteria bacterium]
MLRRRLIPVLFLKDGWMVRSEDFQTHQFIGNPIIHVERMVQWEVDELIVIDISNGPQSHFQHDRHDYKDLGVHNLNTFISRIAQDCRIPLTFGGGLRNFSQVNEVLQAGADKVCLNTMLFDNADELRQCVEAFGSQAIVASIDYKIVDGKAIVYKDYGKTKTDLELLEWAAILQDMQVGELLVNAIDRDGKSCGYDIEHLARLANFVSIPVIGCGGAGHQSHFLKCFQGTELSAVAAGNIFHFTENAYPRAKQYLSDKLVNIR